MMNITTSISISSNRESAMQLVERMNMIKGIKLLLIALSSLILLAGNVSAKAIIYYVHNDHLGTPQILTDDNQQVVWKANYKPFGEAVVDEDPDGDGELVEFNIRLPGQYYDKETGLHYNYYRDYDPTLGRYIQSDPIGLAGGLNTYGYVGGNPIRYTDPLGLQFEGCRYINGHSGAQVCDGGGPDYNNGDAAAFSPSMNDASCNCPLASTPESNSGDLVCIATGAVAALSLDDPIAGVVIEQVCAVTFGDAINRLNDYLECKSNCDNKNYCPT
jgi:RHS repeat-associated protein